MANFSLLAKLGLDSKAFQTGLKGAQGRAGAFSSSMKKLFAAATGGSLLIAAKRAVTYAKEVQNSARIAGLASEDFQKLAFATKTVGIEQQKTADIIKDVSDKVGDFIATGAGPMADFFEKIAPQVGVTAEQFRRLNGKDALQLYVKSLEAANVSQNEMTFYLEAIASDASALIPLLKNDAIALDELGKKAEEAGAVLNEKTSRSLIEASDAISAFGKSILVLTANTIGPFLPVLTKLTEFISKNSEEVARGVKNIVAFAIGFKSAKIVIPAVTKLVGLFSIATRGAAVATFSLSAAITTLKNSMRAFAASTGVGILFVALSVGAEKLTMRLLGAKKGADELKGGMDSLNEQTDEFLESLNSQIALMDKAAESTERYTHSLDDLAKLEKIVKDAQEKRARNQQDLIDKERESFIAAKELQALELRAAGKNAQAEALERNIELMKEAIRISREYGISLEKAAALVRGIEANKPKEDDGGDGGGNGGGRPDKPAEDTRGDFARDLSGEALRKAANEAGKDDNIRFERMGDGGFQQFVNGRKGEKFTEDQLQKGLEGKIEKDPTEATLKSIEKILQGKFVNE